MSACSCNQNLLLAPPPIDVIELISCPASRINFIESYSEYVIPSTTARAKSALVCCPLIPIKLL